ncbi:Phospholipid-transporting ATPase 1 [Arabidopsis thaliana]|jgi:phospholipid-transporting ATPase|uniref:Phospholipid-transporting ATPase 1 n=4 Tax=Arabidopsis TaxID=3701 RepID=ALA1_ARATH|nr:aminophospholipid ATPase 1 [Arabidopsis thaliana]P98204.1 RecName: Full=Phospholipid-transporting ATPase 1; Short=AtALA1; AltName: Full=Aminophospholipid flippase 1 [Arabidopsis thaliana]KAG7601205.1 HAD-like superfamily [Arabidopsis thaliana x Arabidopsis arenosa]KAG7608144.1 P-type ATPase A domain superfamily [Arabidopsis suecica]AAG01899.1 aminophospholipid flippase [Arabidopsis thaliana]AED90805.1 aminophospholipid ATPase 1 [Arabidopsis thaliana]OAO90624.1 ALA1 [Arabidopsis thaliana]|eukprot:NP_568146.1 aminophospholipid ATPase 1 [Arabidopsis thaliana]
MDPRKSIDKPPHHDPILGVSSRWSVSSKDNKEVTFGDLGSKRIRHGSAGADSEMLSMSQKEIKDEDARLIYINDPDRTNERFEFTGNSIKTAKYSVFTFLPRNLFEQFHRVAYIYFLVIAVLNQLPQLAVFGRGASIMPLAFVLLVSAIKDAYEDFRRHRSDRVENNRLALVFEDHQFREKKWKHIRVGEVIKVQSNQTLPCDMVLLATSDPTGVVYVQTTNLDGESNLKTRYAKQETLLKAADMESFNGFIKCEKPNRNIYGFQANMEIDGRRLSLGPSNIILRGCELKNTAWALGVVVYAGGETKAMLNNSGAPSKRSRLETRMNLEIILLSLFLIVLCTIAAATAAVWLRTHRDDLDTILFYRRKDYSERPGGKNYKYYGWGWEIFFTFFMAVIVYQIMIPISLYISMELVRIGQAYFMTNDDQMYDESSDSSFQCRALNINEDLGQIKYLFSDKTGTLTDNKMEFQCACIEGVDYSDREPADSEHPGYSIEVDGIILKPKMRVRVDPVLLQLTKTGKATEEAKRANEFFLSLAACNTIVPIVSNTSDPNVKLVDYQGESPDEQALVYAAAAYGFLLIERTSGHIVINVRGETQRFNVLGLHEFDSDRKRMSVILGCPDMSVKLFVKGADSSMFGVMDESYGGVIHETKIQLHAYSSDGLRTLVVGMRELNDSEFEQWHSSFEAASTALIGRAGLLRKVAGNIETNLRIVGATAIEDKLQRGVPEAIESLRIAGIKVWVLTGDKQETAISIGFSSRLLTRNMRQIVINSNSLDSCRRSLEEANASIASNDESDNVALIIDGTSLIYVLDNDLEDVLFQVACKCSAILCCRVAPFQKAGIVALVKNRTSDMTLAIGDGANDVSMIQMADVGVGISGQEGRQAVMASDFAMGQFRFLVPLLLVHGHWNYQRMGYMILYNFYRNAVFVLILFWYVLFTCYTLTTAITEWSSVLYSVIYTAIPTIIIGILDKDLGRQTLLDHPQLYGVGQRAEGYSTTLFWYTMIDTIWQSAAIFFIPMFAYWGSTIDTSSLGDLWTIAAVVVVNLHLAMDVIRWNWITHAAIWGSIVAACICVIVIDVIPTLPGYWAIFQVGKTWMFWFCLLAIVVTSLLPRFAIKFLVEYYRPSDVRIAREAEKLGTFRESQPVGVEMNLIQDPPRR